MHRRAVPQTLVRHARASSSSQVFPAPWRNPARAAQNGVKTLGSLHQWHHLATPMLSLRRKWDLFSELSELHAIDEHMDLVEFLDGAAAAADVVQHALHSDGFRAFCMHEQSADNVDSSDDVRVLQDVLDRACFQDCVFHMQEADKRGMHYELRHLNVVGCSLFDAEVDAQSARLGVHLDMAQTLRITSSWKDFMLTKQTSMLWVFESPLSSAMQWRVRAMDDFELSKHI
ncbi:Aste57867_14906 [Aphanomyces stellatus]|uniref:Aste57867_14906 protein n=1 Tax=Aphanomyces stellatus TaxID=120398 RepID=A0A485L2R2_9STRA|nr:hypothetical protein As57867_014850 [Aphanomyces stellatus]VFT91722.1 Aste57867_14906 [Aphanomyces stellatus]